MRGHEGCISLFFAGCPMRCEVNPQAGREGTYKITKTTEKKNIVVVGGGIAGMEAARVASLYGHKVTLIEKENELGGHFIEATIPSFKIEAKRFLDWLIRQVKNSNVYTAMNTEATEKVIKSYNPDAVILAVGSSYVRPNIEGIENALSADIALKDIYKVGNNVTVIGGGLVGAETALYLAQEGKNVTIVEMLDKIVAQDEPLSQTAICEELEKANAKIITEARVNKIGKNQLTYLCNGNNEKSINYETVIAALGLAAKRDVVESLNNICDETYVIGDAIRGRKIYNCMHEAWTAVRKISGV
jgi:pyruvate/2-oxoglutarate dehydrogenase complex dihydrolipoamide dehydrogenase (E3) component